MYDALESYTQQFQGSIKYYTALGREEKKMCDGMKKCMKWQKSGTIYWFKKNERWKRGKNSISDSLFSLNLSRNRRYNFRNGEKRCITSNIRTFTCWSNLLFMIAVCVSDCCWIDMIVDRWPLLLVFVWLSVLTCKKKMSIFLRKSLL